MKFSFQGAHQGSSLVLPFYSSSLRRIGLLALFIVLSVGHGQAADAAADAPKTPQTELVPPLQLSNPTTFEVEMTTSLVIPNDGKKVSELRIWQAMPTLKQWSGVQGDVKSGTAAQTLTFEPANGVQEQLPQHDSNDVVWREKRNFAPGTTLSFASHYTVHSVSRHFDADHANFHWPTQFTPPDGIEPDLASTADQIRQAMNPAQAVQEFCARIKKNRRGHCGHIYNVFAQMCKRVGIPVRTVRGLNLNTPDGHGKLFDVRADWTNIHTWAEVYFPEVGWVEVEPYKIDSFTIPAQYIQNNRWFQNYVVKICVDGKFQGAGFTPEDGAFVSPYQVANLITFQATKE
jgi:hypothetical protein